MVEDNPLCWICGGPADSAEHIFKARDLRRIFAASGSGRDNRPFHFHNRGDGHSRIAGPKSKRMKYRDSLCQPCNTGRTSAFDRAYDRLADWFMDNQLRYDVAEIDLEKLFGSDFRSEVDNVRRYCAKSLGCRIVDATGILPDAFPNPVTGVNMDRLGISICRLERFHGLDGYQQGMFSTALTKGDLYANISKTLLEDAGLKKAANAVWWEGIGHFQISYWFNIEMNPVFGEPFTADTATYLLIASDLDEVDLTGTMSDWLAAHPTSRLPRRGR